MKSLLTQSDKLFNPEYRFEGLNERDMVVNQHGYGCLVRGDSDCGGATVK